VKVNLIASRNGKRVTIPIINLGQAENKKQQDRFNDRFNYRFKYFQHLTGTLTFDEQEVPLSIQVVARPAKSGQQTIEKHFPWQAEEEKLANVE